MFSIYISNLTSDLVSLTRPWFNVTVFCFPFTTLKLVSFAPLFRFSYLNILQCKSFVTILYFSFQFLLVYSFFSLIFICFTFSFSVYLLFNFVVFSHFFTDLHLWLSLLLALIHIFHSAGFVFPRVGATRSVLGAESQISCLGVAEKVRDEVKVCSRRWADSAL